MWNECVSEVQRWPVGLCRTGDGPFHNGNLRLRAAVFPLGHRGVVCVLFRFFSEWKCCGGSCGNCGVYRFFFPLFNIVCVPKSSPTFVNCGEFFTETLWKNFVTHNNERVFHEC